MFNTEYRHILFSVLPDTIRYYKFRHCIEWYCLLTRQKFHETYSRLGEIYGFDSEKKPDRLQTVKAVACLKVEREAFLKKLHEFGEKRLEEKARGRRVPRESQIKELYAPDWIVRP